MRASLATAAAVGAVVMTVTIAQANPTPSGVRGVVLDTTCYGPCAIDDHPEPYRGNNARIIVRMPADPSFRRGGTVEQGRFRIRLAPGVYRVSAHVPGKCWEEETRRVAVHRGEFTRVELDVHNACIL